MHFCYCLITLFTLLLPLHIIYFLRLLSNNHKCIQTYYFPLLYKPVAQNVKMVMKNFLTRSSRLCDALVAVPVALWSLPLFCFTRESLSLYKHYLYNKYTLFVIFDYL
jgi:hypothetical protein